MAGHTAVKLCEESVVISSAASDYRSEADLMADFLMPNFSGVLTRVYFICDRMKFKEGVNYVDYKLELLHVLDSVYSFFEVDKDSAKFDSIKSNSNLEDIVELRKKIPVLRHLIQNYNRIVSNNFEQKEEFYKNKLCPAIEELGTLDSNFKQTFYKICQKEGKTIDDYLFRK